MGDMCRCCMTSGCYFKDITSEYVWLGKKEVYIEMLNETFDLDITSTGHTMSDVNICEPCVCRLRDAAEFKKQVQNCQSVFTQISEPSMPIEYLEGVLQSEVKNEVRVKSEAADDDFDDPPPYVNSNDDFKPENDDSDDDFVLETLRRKRSKIEKSLYNLDEELVTDASAVVKQDSSRTNDRLQINWTSSRANKPASKTLKRTLVRKTTKSLKDAVKISLKSDKVAPKSSLGSKKVLKKASVEDDGYSSKTVKTAEHADRQNARIIVKHTTAFPFRLPARSIVCTYCCKSFPLPSLFRRHMLQHHQQFSVSGAFSHMGNVYLKVDVSELCCRVCSSPLESLSAAAQHLSQQHGFHKLDLSSDIGLLPFRFPDDNKFLCAVCQRSFPGLIELSRHTGTHFEKYPCETCGKCYTNKTTLRVHVTYSHQRDGAVLCRKCKLPFPTNEDKNRHVSETKECWQYTCWTCRERFRSYRHKRRHMEEQHGATSAYSCTECGLSFDSGSKRNRHFRLEHTEGAFVCSCCGLKFDCKNEFESHRFVHTKELLVKCEFCNKSFSRQKSLKQHMWIHMEEKRFQCKPCNKQFNQRVSWRTHMKSYHPEQQELDKS